MVTQVQSLILFNDYFCSKKKWFINCSYAGRVVVVSEENPLLLTSNKIKVSAVTKVILQIIDILKKGQKQSCTYLMIRKLYEFF